VKTTFTLPSFVATMAKKVLVKADSWKYGSVDEVSCHDYTRRSWGHNYELLRSTTDGFEHEIAGWGPGIEEGQLLLLPTEDGRAVKWRVIKVRYCDDPKDMWFATIRHLLEGTK
jgi:hypothetical protein